MDDGLLPDPTADILDRLPADAPILVPSRGARAIPHLPALLGGRRIVTSLAERPAAVAGWGARHPGQRARLLAGRLGLPLIRLEDALFRSVGLGKAGAPTVGVLVDGTGLHHDARAPSRMERVLASAAVTDSALRVAAAPLFERVLAERLTKYNVGLDRPPALPPVRGSRVLVVDQVRGDRSVAGAGADAMTFERMLRAALERHGAANVVIRTHPDSARGYARTYLSQAGRALGIPLIDDETSPHATLDVVDEVYTVSSQLGFEALMRGRTVHTFGMPFYAGWGATRDVATGPVAVAARARRGVERDALSIFIAAAILCSRYADPVTKRPLDLAGALDRLVDWRRRDRALDRPTAAYGFPGWKSHTLAAFFSGSGARVRRMRRWRPPPVADARFAGSEIAVWGVTDPPGFEERCREAGFGFVRVEDGFLRSVGLGSDLTRAGSLVVDPLGIHYDARRPSGLEWILSKLELDEPMRRAAERLRERVVAMALTKYNLDGPVPDLRTAAAGRRVVLVVGQVPGDAATRLAAGGFADSLSLVRAARRARPDAFLVYKEHPDVVARNRRGHGQHREIAALADLVLTEGDIGRMFAMVDEVHVVSSLAGFEALLRGVPVVCWGRPFYAGWGLTTDKAPMPRRTRRLDLATLVAGALMIYPRYADPLTGVPCGVEDYLEALAAARRAAAARRPIAFPAARQLVRLSRWMLHRAPA